MFDPESVRENFPIIEKAIYLNHAAIGPSPVPVQKECEKWLVHHKAYGELYFKPLDKMFEELDDYRKIIGSFIKAKYAEEEIAFTYNTSYGLSAIAEALEWNSGKDKIILNDLEYTSNSFTYQVLAKKHKLQTEVIKNVNGILQLEDFEAALDDSTRLIAISHVQFGNGFRIDLKELAKLAHENDALVIVDAIQSCGAMPLDVQQMDIDFMAAGGYKWLLGPLGTGFLYAKKDLAEQLNPCFVGSMSDSNPMELSHHQYVPGPGAKRFQASLGPNAMLLAEAVKFLDKIGISNIYNHIMNLTTQIIEFVEETKNFQLQSPIEDIKYRSGIINFKCPRSKEIVMELRNLPKQIAVSYREGGIRLSPHCYNTNEEIQKSLEQIKSLSMKS
ncbi:MAG: aminotransferase class V-fold PLP-dependent enzyme [Candidatus Hodarchaeales archaeon]